METEPRELKLKRVYRHFKGDHYLVEDVALHSETEEELVIYRKLYGDGSLWARPKALFLAEVDREKYPNATQRYRFQLMEIESVAHRPQHERASVEEITAPLAEKVAKRAKRTGKKTPEETPADVTAGNITDADAPSAKGETTGTATASSQPTGQVPAGCGWENSSALMKAYHDERWCKPKHDDRELFALLVLEGMQSGLSWATIINKEAAFREAFDGFVPEKVAAYGPEKVEELMGNKGIIRSRQKINAAITNAQSFLEVQREFGSFDAYIWSFTQGEIIDHHPKRLGDVPAQSSLSVEVSKDLKARGFKYVGPVIVYSYLQAVGVINDHLESCPMR